MKILLKNAFTLIFIFTLGLGISIVHAADPEVIQLKSTVSAVTVFEDRAMVTRTASPALPTGEYRLLFDKLPDTLVKESIRVKIKEKDNVTLKDIKYKKTYYSEISDKERKLLYDKKNQHQEQIDALNDTITQAENEKKFVKKIVEKITDVSGKSDSTELNPDNWIKMVSFYRSKNEALDKEIRETRKALKKTREQFKQIEEKIKNIGGLQDKWKNQVEVIAAMKTQGNLNMNLSYLVTGPGWSPVYDLRVRSGKKIMNIAYNAVIRQNSGEDWNNVNITLSTAKPKLRSEQPKLRRWNLSLFDQPQAIEKIRGVKEMIGFTLTAVNTYSTDIDRGSDSGPSRSIRPRSIQQSTSVDNQSASTGFVLEKKNTVKSDNVEHKVSIMSTDLPAHFRYATVPKLMPRAFLKAKIINQSGYPLLPGKANVFLDNNFIAQTNVKHSSPQEAFWIFLGVEEGIKVDYTFIRKSLANKGLFKEKHGLTYESLIKIKNNKTTKVEVIIWDQLPISNHKKIKIELLEPKIAKNSTNPKIDRFNLVNWLFTLKPGKELEIPVKFSVTYPKDKYLDDGHGY